MKSGGENLGELKRTEFGRLPAAWATRSLVEVASKILDFRGRTPRKLGMDWGDGDIPALSAGNVKMGFIDFDEECYFGSEALYKRWMTNGHASKGDLCFTTEAPLGNVAQIPDSRKYILSQRTVLIQPNCAKTDSDYLFQFLKSDRFQAVLEENATGSTAKGIKRRRLEQLQVVCPPLQEQRAIGAALSDVDALLAKLDAFIAKKRDLKQAAMQQLLTGQTRLPGFHGEWEGKRLGDIFEITSSKRVFQSEWRSEGIPFYRARELAVLGETGRVDNDLFITRQLYETHRHANGVPAVGDMLVTGVGTLGKAYVVSDDCEFYFKDGNIIWFQIGTSMSAEFLRQLYLTPAVTRQIAEGAAGTTVGTYTITAAKKTTVPFPPLPEQTAIAVVLSDMDAELAALEARRDKTRVLKQGMMQELLAGRIRLV